MTRQQCFQEPFRASKSSCTEGSSLWKLTSGKDWLRTSREAKPAGPKTHVHMLFVHALRLPSLLGKRSVERRAQTSYSWGILLPSSLPTGLAPTKACPCEPQSNPPSEHCPPHLFSMFSPQPGKTPSQDWHFLHAPQPSRVSET